MYTSHPELRSNIGYALEGRREQFVIQGHLCSVWENGQYLRTRDAGKALEAFEDQLLRFHTAYLDVGMIHYIDSEEDFRQVFEGEIIELALRLKQEGRIHHIGMSSHNPVIAKLAVETGLIDVLHPGRY